MTHSPTCIVRSSIGWREERNILYKSVETSPEQTVLKTVRLTTTRNGPKWTISVNGRLGLLQMVSKPSIE